MAGLGCDTGAGVGGWGVVTRHIPALNIYQPMLTMVQRSRAGTFTCTYAIPVLLSRKPNEPGSTLNAHLPHPPHQPVAQRCQRFTRQQG